MRELSPYYQSLEPRGVNEGPAGDNEVVVALAGEFGGYAERLFLGCVQELLSQEHAEVRFDFSAVRFPDTTGLRCLFQARRAFRQAGRSLELSGLPEGLQRILSMVSAQSLAQAVEEMETAGLPSKRC